MADGRLVLVATPIGNLGDLTPRAAAVLREADVIAAEDTRRTRGLLTHAGVPAAGRLRSVHGHNERGRARELVAAIAGGATVAVVTDAGMPGISDPGAHLVRACLDAGLAVEVVPGASAVLTALVLSGLPTDRFVFDGFLPRKGGARAARLEELRSETRTIVFFEAPGRVAATLTDLAAVCGADRRVAVARELTKLHEEVWRGLLGAAVAQFDQTAPRGEVVIVVEGCAPGVDDPDDDELAAAAVGELREGRSTREAADNIADRFGVSRRRAYDAVLAQRRAP
jgi:16S rRNA (cytidine1402-2'-O)-methyltransferase